MGCGQAKGCEVKQICGRLCRNHKGTRRRLPLSWCSMIHPNQFQVVKFQQNFQVPKNDRSFYYLKTLAATYQMSFPPTSERYTASSSSGSSQRLGTHEAELTEPPWRKRRGMVCSWGTYPIFLGVGEHLISLCFASWLLFGECTQENRSATHGRSNFPKSRAFQDEQKENKHSKL